MTHEPWRAISTSARGLTLLAAFAALAGYLVVALARIDYPFEIEWMEGGSRGHVERLRAGAELYGPPSLDFTPFIYTPLYFYVGSWLPAAVGEGFAPLRGISLAASLVCFSLVGWLVARDGGDRRAALSAAGLFAATFAASGAWFDLARVDSLFLALALGSVCVLRAGSSAAAGICAGLLGAAAFFTKQTALIFLAPFAAYAAVARGRLWGAFLVTFAGAVVVGCLAFAAHSHGWFGYYAFELPARHELRWSRVERFWRLDLLARLPVASAAAVGFLASGSAGGRPGARHFHLCLAAGAIAASWFSRIHSGGYLNVLMPAHAAIAVLFGLGLSAFWRRPRGPRSAVLETLVCGLCLAQFALLAYDPREQIPDARDLQAGQELVARIRAIDGEVLVVHHGYLTGLAGKPTTAQWMAVTDVLRGDPGAEGERLRGEIRSVLRRQRYSFIITDTRWYDDELASSYVSLGPALRDADAFWPKTGRPLRPDAMYVPRGLDAP